jgi:hypothetical protein
MRMFSSNIAAALAAAWLSGAQAQTQAPPK